MKRKEREEKEREGEVVLKLLFLKIVTRDSVICITVVYCVNGSQSAAVRDLSISIIGG